MGPRSELGAVLVASLAVFTGIVAPGPAVMLGLGIVGVGLCARFSGTRRPPGRGVHNRR